MTIKPKSEEATELYSIIWRRERWRELAVIIGDGRNDVDALLDLLGDASRALLEFALAFNADSPLGMANAQEMARMVLRRLGVREMDRREAYRGDFGRLQTEADRARCKKS